MPRERRFVYRKRSRRAQTAERIVAAYHGDGDAVRTRAELFQSLFQITLRVLFFIFPRVRTDRVFGRALLRRRADQLDRIGNFVAPGPAERGFGFDGPFIFKLCDLEICRVLDLFIVLAFRRRRYIGVQTGKSGNAFQLFDERTVGRGFIIHAAHSAVLEFGCARDGGMRRFAPRPARDRRLRCPRVFGLRHRKVERSLRRVEVGERGVLYVVRADDFQTVRARVEQSKSVFQRLERDDDKVFDLGIRAAIQHGNGILCIFRSERRRARRYARRIGRAVHPTRDRGRRDPRVCHVLRDGKGDISGQLGEVIRSVRVRHKPITAHGAPEQVFLRRGDIRKGNIVFGKRLPVNRLRRALIYVINDLFAVGKEFRSARDKVARRRVGVILPTRHAGRRAPIVIRLRHVERGEIERIRREIESRRHFRYAFGQGIIVQPRIVVGRFHRGEQVIRTRHVSAERRKRLRHRVAHQPVFVKREPDQTRQRFFIRVEHGELHLQARKVRRVQIERRARNQIFRFVVLAPIPTHHVGRSRPAVCRLGNHDHVARRLRRFKRFHVAVRISRRRAVKAVGIGFEQIEDRRDALFDSALFVHGKFEYVIRRHGIVGNELSVLSDETDAFLFDSEHDLRVRETERIRNTVDLRVEPVERPGRNLGKNAPTVRRRLDFIAQRNDFPVDFHIVGHVLLRPAR